MEPSITIRRCEPGDEQALSLVGRASFLEAFAGIINGGDILAHCDRQHAPEKYRAWLHDPASSVWLAEASPGRAPVGYLVVTTPDLPLEIRPDDSEVKRIYLLHRFQGFGLGRNLMAEAVADAKTRSIRRLLLGVYSRNEAAIAFYQRRGFLPVGKRTFKVGDHTYDDAILALSL